MGLPPSVFQVLTLDSYSAHSGLGAAMQRREFITLLVGGANIWPRAVRAQQPAKVKRIAIVHPSINVSELSITSEHQGYRTLFEELSRLGHFEAQTLVVERFSGEGNAKHYADLAHDVVRSTNPDLIIAIVDPLAVRFKKQPRRSRSSP